MVSRGRVRPFICKNRHQTLEKKNKDQHINTTFCFQTVPFHFCEPMSQSFFKYPTDAVRLNVLKSYSSKPKGLQFKPVFILCIFFPLHYPTKIVAHRNLYTDICLHLFNTKVVKTVHTLSAPMTLLTRKTMICFSEVSRVLTTATSEPISSPHRLSSLRLSGLPLMFFRS